MNQNSQEMPQTVRLKEFEVKNIEKYLTMHKKSWLDTYPNTKIGLTREKIEELRNQASFDNKVVQLTQKIQDGLLPNMRVLYVNESLIGVTDVAMSDLEGSNYGRIQMIYLDPDYIGKGYGKRLMDNALAQLRAMGAESFFVEVVSYNQRAIDFYTKAGFTNSVAIEPAKVGEFALPQIRMFLIKNT